MESIKMWNNKSSTQIIKQRFIAKLVHSLLEYIVLGHYENASFSGYDVISFIPDKFGVSLSAATIYSTLYSMERRELLTGYSTERKRVYKVTELGKLTFKVVASKADMEALMTRILMHP
jgi:DNA-binding PadR family transcriptional regulator